MYIYKNILIHIFLYVNKCQCKFLKNAVLNIIVYTYLHKYIHVLVCICIFTTQVYVMTFLLVVISIYKNSIAYAMTFLLAVINIYKDYI